MTRRILVIEDDPTTAETVRLYLERDGFEVQVASEGRGGLELARAGGIALIVLDLMLPCLSGTEVARALRRGIAPEHLDHVFERFYRTDPSRGRATGGAGLGLTIVKQLVSAWGGTIRMQSKPGHGTQARFDLPRLP